MNRKLRDLKSKKEFYGYNSIKFDIREPRSESNNNGEVLVILRHRLKDLDEDCRRIAWYCLRNSAALYRCDSRLIPAVLWQREIP
jgi:hypothetical protein